MQSPEEIQRLKEIPVAISQRLPDGEVLPGTPTDAYLNLDKVMGRHGFFLNEYQNWVDPVGDKFKFYWCAVDTNAHEMRVTLDFFSSSEVKK